MTPHVPAATGQVWRKPPFIRNPWLRWALIIGALVYLVLALNSININPDRIARGMQRATRIFSAFLQPDFTSRWRDIQAGILESLTMTVVSTVAGVILSIPIGFGAARNLAPLPIYLFCRGIVTLSRTFQEVIIAIVFVVMFGFGPLAGVCTLTFATIGFLAKLLAEDIEEIDPAQMEAIRATGASFPQLISYAILPQVTPRLVGLSIYRFDINLRESAIVGIVGAGGIGSTLQTSFTRYDYDVSSAILIIIIILVMMTEVFSGVIRKRLQ
ncbi:MAG: phosphonate ABC transporter, permease protein PhnE [Candidatus Viridilinea halotolerans]|uniref:Phosphonate ABC transporter, permease protein PhnE n=1 Tax=Candidatus Viridilinea halotolerans TaxID=2491704 RepID=A0A426TTZ6_9CHLR|nr:MAG: phosphonate ABC transporter, permease protein PhnE [Candidatus Viridilinea halotolerans]